VRIVFLNRFYWPNESATSQLLRDLATHLASRGHEVHVIASNDSRAPRANTERAAGVTIHRAGRHGAALGIVRKGGEFAEFHVAALRVLAGLARRGDLVVAMTDPPLLAVGVAAIAHARGARVVHWTQDVYPEIAGALSPQAILRFAAACLLPLRDNAWATSEACVVIGHDMADLVRSRGVEPGRVHVIPNWAPLGLAPQPASAGAAIRRAWGLEDRFVIAYSGNLGRVHDLTAIEELAAALDPSLAFVIIGDGPGRTELVRRVQARGLRHVHFLPAQPRAELAASLAAADVHLVTLLPACARFVFPSKFYGITRVGRPVAFIGPTDTELAAIVRTEGLGVVAPRAQVADLARTLQQWAGSDRGAAAGRRAAAHGERNQASARFADWENLLTALHAP
jgi:hypothetical protein